jgi:hypothetical protein
MSTHDQDVKTDADKAAAAAKAAQAAKDVATQKVKDSADERVARDK